MRPRLLDLFCGGGGAGAGYARAGFDVVGVDIAPQPNYPFEFVQEDALVYLRDFFGVAAAPLDFDVIHASPPCPRYSSISRVHGTGGDHPDLVGPVRKLLEATGLPYVIENVPGAPLLDPIRLCGSSFGLGTVCDDGEYRQLRRHRLFESNVFLLSRPCAHEGEPVGVYGHGGGQQKTARSGRGVNRGYMARKGEASRALGIDWMIKRELSDSIPPAYTEFIGAQLLEHLAKEAA